MNGDRDWHLDRRVPITLIGAILCQTIVFAWGASNLWTRVDYLERQSIVLVPLSERIGKLETKTDIIAVTVADLSAFLRRALPGH